MPAQASYVRNSNSDLVWNDKTSTYERIVTPPSNLYAYTESNDEDDILYTETTLLNQSTTLYDDGGNIINRYCIDTISNQGLSFTVKEYYICYNPTGVTGIIYEDYQGHYWTWVNGSFNDVTAATTELKGTYLVWAPWVFGTALTSSPRWSAYWGYANNSSYGLISNSSSFSGYPYQVGDTYFKTVPQTGITDLSTYKKVSSGESTGSYTYSYIYTGHTDYPSGTNQRYWYLHPWIVYADPNAKVLQKGALYYQQCYPIKATSDKKFVAFVGDTTGTVYYFNTGAVKGYNNDPTDNVIRGSYFYYTDGFTGRVGMHFNVTDGKTYVLRNPDLNGYTGQLENVTKSYFTWETATRDSTLDRYPAYYAWTGTSTSDTCVYTTSSVPSAGAAVYGANNWIGTVSSYSSGTMTFNNSLGDSCSFTRSDVSDCLSLSDAYFNVTAS